MQRTFWQATPDTAQKLVEIHKHWQTVEYPKLESLKVELGAVDIIINKGPTGIWNVLGFKFPEGVEVNRDVLRKLRSPEGIWRAKVGTDLYNRLERDFTSNWLQRCKCLFGIPATDPRIPGITFLPDSVLVEWSYDCWNFPPCGCVRISDIEFENLMSTTTVESLVTE